MKELLLQLDTTCEILEEHKALIDYLDAGFYVDFTIALSRARIAYGEKTDEFLTRDGKILRNLIDRLDDVSVGVVTHMVAAMIRKSDNEEK